MENSDDKNGDNDHLTAKSSYWYNFPKKMMTRMTRMVMMIILKQSHHIGIIFQKK